MDSKEQRELDQKNKLDELKRKQKAGKIKFVKCNIDPDFEISEQEKDDYIVLYVMEKHLNPGAKDFAKIERTILIHAGQFESMYANKAFAGYDEVKIVHDPRIDAPAPSSYEFIQRNVDVSGSPSQNNQRAASEQMKALNERRKALDEQEEKIEAAAKAFDKKVADANESFEQKIAEMEKRQKALDDKESELKAKEQALNKVPVIAPEPTATNTAAPAVDVNLTQDKKK